MPKYSEKTGKLLLIKRKFETVLIAEKTAGLLILISLFSAWVYFPLSSGKNSFDFETIVYFSFGTVLFTLSVLFLLGFRRTMPLIIILIFSFPIMLAANYEFNEKILDELIQVLNIKKFAKAHVFEPNIVYFEKNADITGSVIQWDSLILKFKLVSNSLGFGYLLSFFCALFLFSRLKIKTVLIVISVTVLLLLPIIYTDYYLQKAEKKLLAGKYSESAANLKKAEKINGIFRNGKLVNTEFFNILVGESLYRGGYSDAPQADFFLAYRYEQLGSYQDALNLYQLTTSLPPSDKALARTMTKKSFVDMEENRFGSSYASLNTANSINPDSIEAIFYLQFVASYLNDHERSIEYGRQVTEKSGNKVLLSDVYNLLAKSYSELGQKQRSKDMYKLSLNYYDSLRKSNYPAWKGLAGW